MVEGCNSNVNKGMMITTFKQLLKTINVNVPNKVIRHLLDTPVGMTVRGISDALDALHISNEVYRLPEKYLSEIAYPYMMVLPNRQNPFNIITDDTQRRECLPEWDGVVLTYSSTRQTPRYKYVLLRNIWDYIMQYYLFIILPGLIFAVLLNTDMVNICHVALSMIGVTISVVLLQENYLGANVMPKYCKHGSFFDCEHVLKSKGSRLLGIFNLDSLSFIFFVTHILLALIYPASNLRCSILLIAVGLCFTFYSVIYQLIILRKICFFCMLINVIIWCDAIILFRESVPFTGKYIFHICFVLFVSYIILYVVRGYFARMREIQFLQKRAAALYRKDVFCCLLSQEKLYEDIDDSLVEHYDNAFDSDVTITFFVHPECKNCEKVFSVIPILKAKAKIKLVSLATNNVGIHEYCKRNKIFTTPTILVNGYKLPEMYSVDDLKYLI